MKGSSDFRPFEYVRSAGFIQKRSNVTKRTITEQDGSQRTFYDFDYELLPDDGTVAEELITSSVPTFTTQEDYDAFIKEREG